MGAIKLAMAGTQDCGADFLHCWLADSMWLEHGGSLITKR